jgi:hypothetical protein
VLIGYCQLLQDFAKPEFIFSPIRIDNELEKQDFKSSPNCHSQVVIKIKNFWRGWTNCKKVMIKTQWSYQTHTTNQIPKYHNNMTKCSHWPSKPHYQEDHCQLTNKLNL